MIDIAMVAGFVGYAIYSGMSSSEEASKDLDEYFLAGRSLTGTKAGMSMAATQFAADTPLLVCGLIATGGIFSLWRLWIYGLSFLVIGFIFSTKWRRAGVITDAELTEIRYSGKHVSHLRFLKAFYYGTVINCVVLAMVLVAAMRISEVFLLWHEWLPESIYAILSYPIEFFDISLGASATGIDPQIATTNNLFSIFLIVGFTTMYSTTGGLRSVVATDMAQFLFAMVGTIAYAWFILDEVGGFSALYNKLQMLYPGNEFTSITPAKEGLYAFAVLIGIQWIFQMSSDGTGYLAQRSMACKSDRDARFASILFTWAQVFFRSIFWIVIALGLLILYPIEEGSQMVEGFAAQREMLFVQGINDFLPPFAKGLMLVGLLGALASTVDTHLNWGASYWSNDIYKDIYCKKFKGITPTNSSLVWVARLSNIGILLIALLIMFNLGSIQEAWQLSLLFGAGMGGVLLLRWLWEGITLYSEILGILSSVILGPILLYTVGEEWLRILIMGLSTTTIAIAAAKFLPKTEESKLIYFYNRVKPQGLWTKTATLAGDQASTPLKKFKSSSALIAICAVSIYFSLVGTSMLLFQGDGVLWGVITLGIGLALVPAWMKKI